jgi:hypothetical protein
MSEIRGLLNEQALTEAYYCLQEIDILLDTVGFELPEDATIDDVPEMVEEFLATEDVDAETAQELQEIIRRLAHAAGRAIRGKRKVQGAFRKAKSRIKSKIKRKISGVKRGIKKRVGAFKKNVGASFRAGVRGQPRKKISSAQKRQLQKAGKKSAQKRKGKKRRVKGALPQRRPAFA